MFAVMVVVAEGTRAQLDALSTRIDRLPGVCDTYSGVEDATGLDEFTAGRLKDAMLAQHDRKD